VKRAELTADEFGGSASDRIVGMTLGAVRTRSVLSLDVCGSDRSRTLGGAVLVAYGVIPLNTVRLCTGV
jgi:hypothetical protein